MSGFLTEMREWHALGALAMALALGAGPAPAQEAPPAGGAPQSLVPDDVTPAPLPPAARLAPRNATAVVVGDLGTVEGPVAGTLDDASGGLGYNAWAGSDRATIASMIQSLPATMLSPTARLLLRKLLLTTAPPPAGNADMPFNAVRLQKLLDTGMGGDAADLAARIQAPKSAEISRAQADALLFAGREMDACGDATAFRLDSAEPFWVQLRAYCYAVAGDNGALDLTRSVMASEGTADPAFDVLLDGIVSAKAVAPTSLPIPDSLHVHMLARLNLPMNRDIATGLGLTASVITAGSPATPRALRLAAAEKALRAGAIPTELLAQTLDLVPFRQDDLVGAAALARSEPLMTALARLRATLKTAQAPDVRAEAVYTAFQIGEREGLLPQIAALFADDAAAILPASDWGNWSETMARGLLLVGRADAAERWYNVINPGIPGADAKAQRLQLELALAQPNAQRTQAAQAILADLAVVSVPAPPPPPPPQFVPDPMNPGQFIQVPGEPLPPPPPAALSVRTQAVLVIGLFDALGRPLNPGALDAAQKLTAFADYAGRRPPPVLMQRIDKAALADSKGEVALSVATAIGPQGAGDLAPDVVVRLVRALETAGLKDAAHSLTMEALLLRPAG